MPPSTASLPRTELPEPWRGSCDCRHSLSAPSIVIVMEPSESASLELLCSTARAKHDSLSSLAYRKSLFRGQVQVLFPLPDIIFSSMFLLIHQVLS